MLIIMLMFFLINFISSYSQQGYNKEMKWQILNFYWPLKIVSNSSAKPMALHPVTDNSDKNFAYSYDVACQRFCTWFSSTFFSFSKDNTSLTLS